VSTTTPPLLTTTTEIRLRRAAARKRITFGVRNVFIAGLLVLIPMVITVKALWWLFVYVDEIAQPLSVRFLGRPVLGIGLLITVAFVFLAGLLFSKGPLRILLDKVEDALDDVPLVGTVYGTTKKVLSGFQPGEEGAFKRFVFARLPGRMVPGFITGQFTIREDGREPRRLFTVYVPTNHLYVGDVLVLDVQDVIETELTVEDGVSLILSTGASVPDRLTRRVP
jgi:uncharacterized membrane protein